MEKEFEWIKAKAPRQNVSKDVGVKAYIASNGKKGITFTFTNTNWLRFAPNQRMIISIVGYRIYFKGDEMQGYKISKSYKRYICRVFNDNVYNFAYRNSGCFFIKYDPREKLYYIDTSEKD